METSLNFILFCVGCLLIAAALNGLKMAFMVFRYFYSMFCNKRRKSART